jgi:hypothetical protein
MVLTLLLVLPELCVEEWTGIGQELKVAAYSLIQRRLSSEATLPVTIVDISALQPQSIPGTDVPTATPRRTLQELIKAIAEETPSAIGVDIDFSPDDKGWIDPLHDPQFFRFCLKLKSDKHIPVFLGVHRSQNMKPEAWLGDQEYESLAAGIAIPNDTRKMLRNLQVVGSPLKSMAFQLADAKEIKPAPWWVTKIGHWAIEMSPETKLTPSLSANEFFVDYSARNLLRDQRVDYESARTDAWRLRERFCGKIVIIGPAELDRTTDVFSVMNESVTGSVIHACAAYTLVQTAPLYALTPFWGNLIVDLGLSLFVLLMVGLTWYSFPGQTVAVHRLQVFSTFVIAAGAVVVGVMFVRTHRIMWDGFIIVLLVLCLHSSFERFVEWLLSARRGNFIIDHRQEKTH